MRCVGHFLAVLVGCVAGSCWAAGTSYYYPNGCGFLNGEAISSASIDAWRQLCLDDKKMYLFETGETTFCSQVQRTGDGRLELIVDPPVKPPTSFNDSQAFCFSDKQDIVRYSPIPLTPDLASEVEEIRAQAIDKALALNYQFSGDERRIYTEFGVDKRAGDYFVDPSMGESASATVDPDNTVIFAAGDKRVVFSLLGVLGSSYSGFATPIYFSAYTGTDGEFEVQGLFMSPPDHVADVMGDDQPEVMMWYLPGDSYDVGIFLLRDGQY